MDSHTSMYYYESLLQHLQLDSCFTQAMGIFPGRIPQSTRAASIPALVWGGLCFYFGCLHGLSDRSDEAVRIHIVPGQLESGRGFQELVDASAVHINPVFTYKAGPTQDIAYFPPKGGKCSRNFDTKLVVEETVDAFSVMYQISTVDGFCAVGPLLLAKRLLEATGLVSCPRKGCPELTMPYPSMVVVEGEGRLSTEDVYQAGHTLVIRQVCGDSIP